VGVHAIKEFMGYRIRLGPDGTIGNISVGNVGVKIILEKKAYVITLRNPHVLVNYVRHFRDLS